MNDTINLLETTKAALAALAVLADRAGGEIIIDADELIATRLEILTLAPLPNGGLRIILKPMGGLH